MKFINRFICLMSFATLAQAEIQIQDNIPSEDNPWYEVSIVIFKQPQHLLQSEQWKSGDELSLSFPRHLIALKDPSEEFPEYPEETPDAAEDAQPETTPEDMEVTLQEGAIEKETIEYPTAFLAQEATDEEFIETVNRLNRSPNFDIIYQKSWKQPGLSKKEALPVLIQAGKIADGIYELEGTTTLHVARYLHLESTLWLSEYVQQLEVIKPWWQENSAAEDPEAESLNSELDLPLVENNNMDSPLGLEPSLSLDGPMGMESPMAIGDTITRYKSIQTGLLNESRRMRSGELHYIDHPLFGMVVKVTPYTMPEPEETENDDAASITPQPVSVN